MSEEKPGLHVDTDWKKQAQEEKRRLAEQEKQRATGASAGTGTASAAPPGGPAPPGEARATSVGGTSRAPREIPPASFASLVQSIVAQILFYLGDLTARGTEPSINLEMAKHHIDTLGVLEDKTRGNLTPEEQRTLDAALYETRMRYVNVASQFVS